MEQSASISNLTKALLLFQVKVETIKFDSNNPFFKSKYASLTHILETIKDALIDCGLVISQFPTDNNGLVTMVIHAESGEYMRSTYFMQPEKNTPQAHGSVVTYQRRYCLQSILNLCFDEDDDANVASHGSSKPKAANPKAANQPKGDKPWLNMGTDIYHRAVEKLQKGETTMEKIQAAFRMSIQVQESLIPHIK